MNPNECGLCGAFGPWRPKGHADFCPRYRPERDAEPVDDNRERTPVAAVTSA